MKYDFKNCDFCKNVFNIKNIDWTNFYIYKDISDANKIFNTLFIEKFKEKEEEYNAKKNKYCCNKHFNLSFWENEIGSAIDYIIYEYKSLNDDNSHYLYGFIPISEEEIDKIKEYYDKKIQYIKNNL
ncbi:hypothetical protein [Clostridium pasteurianum]|uniref:Uncharacterized protein n=1 Tax=Clostridium pasteurianum BC1 TaxID=86416 RepID=R4K8C5_CLOPA|nr:hypothetical protein [Clostridium pasteurianum]AGK96779.1 hypothetical protein Clopa_1879 [Clostridium pasteurianum BC1]